jgi:hypothetical protein
LWQKLRNGNYDFRLPVGTTGTHCRSAINEPYKVAANQSSFLYNATRQLGAYLTHIRVVSIPAPDTEAAKAAQEMGTVFIEARVTINLGW